MLTKTVNLKDFAKELGHYTDDQLEAFKKATIRGMVRSLPDLVAASPVDTGLYAQSWNFNETEFGAVIGNTAPYAPLIEYGSRPFTPPIGPLLAWAKRVLTGQHGTDGQVIDTGQPEDGYSPEVWRLAKGVQKKISERGMQPRHIMEDAIPGIIENIKKEFEELGQH